MGYIPFKKPDGEIVKIPVESEDAALKAGYQYATNEEYQSLKTQLEAEAKQDALEEEAASRPALAALEAVARGVSFGFSPIVLGKVGEGARFLNRTFLEPVIPDSLEKDFSPEAIKAREESLGLAGTGIEVVSGIGPSTTLKLVKGAYSLGKAGLGRIFAKEAGEAVTKEAAKEVSEKVIVENVKKTMFSEIAAEKLASAGWAPDAAKRIASYGGSAAAGAKYGAAQGVGDYLSDTYLNGEESTMEGAMAAAGASSLLGAGIGVALPAGFDATRQALRGATRLLGEVSEFTIPRIGGLAAAESDDIAKAMGIGVDVKAGKTIDGIDIKLTPQEIRQSIPRNKIEAFRLEATKQIEAVKSGVKEMKDEIASLKDPNSEASKEFQKIIDDKWLNYNSSVPEDVFNREFDLVIKKMKSDLAEQEGKLESFLKKADDASFINDPKKTSEILKDLEDLQKKVDFDDRDFEKLRSEFLNIKTDDEVLKAFDEINKIRKEIGLETADPAATIGSLGIGGFATAAVALLDATIPFVTTASALAKVVIQPMDTIKILSGIERASKNVQNVLKKGANQLVDPTNAITQRAVRLPSQTQTSEDRRSKVEESLKTLRLFSEDPEKLADSLNQTYGGLPELNPTLATKLQQNNINAMAFLDSVAPKQPANWDSLQGWKPSDQQINTYSRYLKTVERPGEFLQDVLDKGYVEKESLAAMEAVYPEMLQDIRADLIQKLSEVKAQGKTIPARKMQIIKQILGTNTSTDQASLKRNQEVMQPPASRGPSGNVSKASEREQTQTQRLSQ